MKKAAMRTRIIIEHTDEQALKTSPIWAEIMAVFLKGGTISVVEIGDDDAPDDDDDFDPSRDI